MNDHTVASAAAGRETLISQDVQRSLGAAYPLVDPKTLLLKGLAETHRLFPILVP
jgi:hypothetical protein